jgi:hypothetical protein
LYGFGIEFETFVVELDNSCKAWTASFCFIKSRANSINDESESDESKSWWPKRSLREIDVCGWVVDRVDCADLVEEKLSLRGIKEVLDVSPTSESSLMTITSRLEIEVFIEWI